MKPITKRTKVTMDLLVCTLKDLEFRYRDSVYIPKKQRFVPQELRNAWKIIENAKKQLELSEETLKYLE